MFELSVVSGTAIRGIIAEARPEIVDEVRETYLTHAAGDTVNPDSYFLRFPDRPDSRIIALPARLGGRRQVAGIKWIASFPSNIERNIPRASAVLVLNDAETGYPFAFLEASQISAARTAASAALAAQELTGGRTADRFAVIGGGVIAKTVLDFLAAQGWSIGRLAVYDREPRYARNLAAHAARVLGCDTVVESGPEAAIKDAEAVLLATTAAEPYLEGKQLFRAGQVVLNISLRDLSPEIVLGACNILDDVEHCLKANTSPHLAEQACGNRDFVDGTLADVLNGSVSPDRNRPVVFSPFGLGVLDLAVGALILDHAEKEGSALRVDGFFGETERW
jgi:2,3-diaminopropionate biosynthesis protein SbnB